MEGRAPEFRDALTVSIEDARRLVDEYAGKGQVILTARGKWGRQEACEAEGVIGYDALSGGVREPTRRFKIMYADKSVHIVPAPPKSPEDQP